MGAKSNFTTFGSRSLCTVHFVAYPYMQTYPTNSFPKIAWNHLSYIQVWLHIYLVTGFLINRLWCIYFIAHSSLQMDESQHESRRVSKARRGSSAAAAAATALEDDSDALGDADEEDDDDEEEEGDESGAEEEEDEDEEEADEEEPNDEEDPESQSSPQSICLSVTVHQFLVCTNLFAIRIGSIDCKVQMYLTDENSSQDWNEAEDPSDPSTHASANPASIKNPLLPGGAVTSSLKKKAQGLSLKIPKH